MADGTELHRCPTCNGSGIVHWTENGAPWGEAFWAMPMEDMCNCLYEDKCPGCLSPIVLTEGEESCAFKCAVCGMEMDVTGIVTESCVPPNPPEPDYWPEEDAS